MSRLNRKWWTVVAFVTFCMVVLIAAMLLNANKTDNNITPVAETSAVQTTPTAGMPLKVGSAYTPVAKNERISLAVNAAGQLRLTDHLGGHDWFSNPSEEALRSETVKGFWRNSLESPFMIDYIDLNGISTEVITANAKDLETSVSFHQMKDGVEIVFDLSKVQIRFSYLVKLADDHLEVEVPYDRISETGSAKVVSISVMPLFGAMQGLTNTGYMFVPDGVGALIPFDPTTKYSSQYTSKMYGSDISAIDYEKEKVSRYNQEIPADSLYPVFGIVSGNQAFVSIIDEGEYTSRISATPGGMYTSFNWVAAQFVYRQGYFKRTNLFGEGFHVFQENMMKEDRRILYYFLSGEDADYVGMAKAYRQYLMDKNGLARREDAAYPLDLYLMGGDQKPALLGRELVAATTFEQAGQIVQSLKESGVESLDVTLMGWEKNGYLQNTPGRFPPSKALGGTEGLSRLAGRVHESGGKLYLSDNFNVAFGANDGFEPKYDAVRDLNGKVISVELPGLQKYWIHPDLSREMLFESFGDFRLLGIDGLYHTGLGEAVFSDETPSHLTSRKRTGAIFGDMLRETAEQLGEARVKHGNAYVLPYADHIGSIPFDTSYDMLTAKTVPFYLIALHGLVSYSGIPQNMQDEPRISYLKSIEYGALPSYLLTFEDPIVLKDTLSRWIYSSQFKEWKEQVAAQYTEREKSLGRLSNQMIVNHRELAKDVFETTYENGTKVIVNYTKKPYVADSVSVEPENYSVVEKEGRS
ncbi:DUF5696 domain-containing protein [Paenibacillus nasutitermitis]|uniref:Uncharacterized protein n=1 Tax=Paenibacillus nasutitermitis TaxID=1652958 RepID=A0A917E2I9_9BACL|nr:DUF5696 domain-containing protein [Paenibacillus nasutitermitis]GGD93488.1 hypothetical protein GCM10010911_60160 [Paenibacillus nasutitermitis]